MSAHVKTDDQREVADGSETDDPSATTPLTRRGVLGAIAVGAVAVACGTGSEDALSPVTVGPADSVGSTTGSTSSTVSTTGTSGGQVVNALAPAEPSTATGTELEQVVLPSRADTGTTPAAPAAPAPAPASPAPAAPAPQAPDASTPPATNPEAPKLPQTSDGTTTTTTSATTAAPGATSSTTASTTPVPPPVTGATSASPLLALTRLSFGPTPGEMARVAALGASGYISEQLARTSADAAVERQLRNYQVLKKAPSQAYDHNAENAGARRRRIYQELRHSSTVRARYSTHQLFEMVCHMWYDHFNIHLSGTGHEHLHLPYQEQVIRANAMGTFRDLLVATANSSAMMTYLNNDVSNASSPNGINENYGRELLELHTLGIDATGNQVYSQTDVEEASRVMSGWSMYRDKKDTARYSQFWYRDDYHDKGEASLLGGAWTTAGLSGKARGDSLLRFLATHPSTANYIAYKICRRFVSDTPPQSLVDSTARVYLANDTAIVPMLRHVFFSTEFANSEGSKVRRPFEAMIAGLRATNAAVDPDPTTRTERSIQFFLASTENIPWGWDMPNGYAEDASHWLTADKMLRRWNFLAGVGRNGNRDLPVDLAGVRPDVQTVGAMVASLAYRFGIGSLSADMVAAAAKAVDATPDASASDVSDRQLGLLVGLLLSHPLFQTR